MSEQPSTPGDANPTDASTGDGGTTVNTEGGDAVVQTGGEATTEAPSGGEGQQSE